MHLNEALVSKAAHVVERPSNVQVGCSPTQLRRWQHGGGIAKGLHSSGRSRMHRTVSPMFSRRQVRRLAQRIGSDILYAISDDLRPTEASRSSRDTSERSPRACDRQFRLLRETPMTVEWRSWVCSAFAESSEGRASRGLCGQTRSPSPLSRSLVCSGLPARRVRRCGRSAAPLLCAPPIYASDRAPDASGHSTSTTRGLLCPVRLCRTAW
jgi:hypothetical protein